MAVSSVKLTAVRGDTQEFDFAYSQTPDIAVFVLTSPAHPYDPVLTKSLSSGISAIPLGLRVRLDQADLLALPNTLTVLSYYLRVTQGDDVTVIAAGALYIYSGGGAV